MGFRKDQEHTIEAEEAHKAYFLFQNPEERGVFNNGLAVVGRDIRGIEPDYHTTMGWNKTHNLDSNDWNEMRKLNIDTKMRELMVEAKQLSLNPDLIQLPMSEANNKLLN